MAKKSSKNNAAIAGALKKFLGTKANSIGNKGVLPIDEASIDKKYQEPSTAQVMGLAGQDMLANMKMWWETGNFGESEESSDKKESEKVKREQAKKLEAESKKIDKRSNESKINLKELLASNLKNQNLLDKILSEIVLLRKVTEGSLKFEKTARGSAYRDMVSGRYTKVKSSIDKDKTRTIAAAKRSTAITAAKPETPVLTKLSTVKNNTYASSKDLAPKIDEKPAEESDSGLLGTVMDFLPGFGSNKPKPTVPAGAAGTAAKTGLLSRAASFMSGTGGMVAAGLTGAIGGGLYAYDKFNQASNEKQAEVMAAQEQLKAGNITQKEYNQKVEEADKKSVITKGEGVGGGVGRFGGALAGAKLGASFGTFFGPAGTVVGGLAGGALGYMAGGSIGEAVGNIGGRISNFFGGNKDSTVNNIQNNRSQANTVNKRGSFSVTDNGQTTTGLYQDGKYYINNTEVSEKEYNAVREKLGLEKISEKASSSQLLKDSISKDAASLLSPVSASNLGTRINNLSQANNDLLQTQQPANNTTIINNSTSGSGQSGIVALKPGVRPEQSTLTRYLDKLAVY